MTLASGGSVSALLRPSSPDHFGQCLPQQRCFAIADVYLRFRQPFQLEPAVVIFGQRNIDGVPTLVVAQHPDAMHLIMAVEEPDAVMLQGFQHYMNLRISSHAPLAIRDRFQRAFTRTLMNVCDELDLQDRGEWVLRNYGLWQRDDGHTFGEWDHRRSKQKRANDDDYRDLPRPVAQALLGCVAASLDTGKADDARIVLLNERARAHLGCSLHRYKRNAP